MSLLMRILLLAVGIPAGLALLYLVARVVTAGVLSAKRFYNSLDRMDDPGVFPNGSSGNTVNGENGGKNGQE